MSDDSKVIAYVEAVKEQFASGHAGEHAYRPALERLMASFEDVTAVNDPKRSQYGNPDFVFVKKSNKNITFGYAEAKDITAELDKTIKTEQLRRYAGYEKLFLTNYLDFKFFRNGEEYEELSLGKIVGGGLVISPSSFVRLQDVLREFLNQPPETIRNGKRLALIMGGKARRLRDNVAIYLGQENAERNQELEKIFSMMKTLLVHDLTQEKFADMYSQTLVYGLFVARYNDKTPGSFTRSEARDLVPASNPFLREFFDHIVGPRFDSRLAHIVDELCEVFSVSNVHDLVQKHLQLFKNDNEKDPIIHFYEDFLKEYDPAERKKMGAYYTPIPVVRFIVEQVDQILKSEFGLNKGLADNGKRPVIVQNQGTKHKIEMHRVQILDPAVGTATFLNEVIKYVHKSFKGQEGRWPSYAEQDLLPRLHGFELMMAPYTIAHLKLGMTLQETGVNDFSQRLGVYLTNTLEEGQKDQIDLFTQFGLAEIVSKEADAASKIKHERPIMVVMGNPPYSVSSNNKSKFIEKLVADYKKDMVERNIQPLSDDYIKFLRFAEYMIVKNGEGIVAMITNNSYIDGVIHRQMRKHLSESFDKIYILDLHGNSKKKETNLGGGKDENVFDIQQGVSIIIAVKTGVKRAKQLGAIYHSELFGPRTNKFNALAQNPEWHLLAPTSPSYFFVPRDSNLAGEYSKFVSLRELMPIGDAGIKTHRDSFVIAFDETELEKRIKDFYELSEDELQGKYKIRETRDFSIHESKTKSAFDRERIRQIVYRPFDTRWTYHSGWLMDWPREKTMKQFYHKNVALYLPKQVTNDEGSGALVIENIVGHKAYDAYNINYTFPLYIYHDDGTKNVNFNPRVLREFTKNLKNACSPEIILDYIYAILYSPKYRQTYKELLKMDFPRVPAPKSDVEFNQLSEIGERLRELHLMNWTNSEEFSTTYPEQGTDEVEKIIYKNQEVRINSNQYFGNVPEMAWNFYIGGYQPAQKWLKDRKERKLSNDDIEHYQKIIKVLLETDKIMKEIDHTGFMELI